MFDWCGDYQSPAVDRIQGHVVFEYMVGKGCVSQLEVSVPI